MWLRGQGQKCNCLVESKEVLDDDEGKEVCVLPLPSGWWVAMTTLSTPSSMHDSLHLVRELAHPVLDHIMAIHIHRHATGKRLRLPHGCHIQSFRHNPYSNGVREVEGGEIEGIGSGPSTTRSRWGASPC